MSIINSTSSHINPVSSAESTTKDSRDWMLKKSQRKHNTLENEKFKREAEIEQSDVDQLFENQEVSLSDDSHKNAWEHMLMTEISANNEGSEIISEGIAEDILDQNTLAAFSSRYLSGDEITSLFEFYEDANFQEKAQALSDELLNCSDGAELDLLNNLLIKGQFTTSQSYMLLCYIMAQLHAKKRKRLFDKQLSEWLQRFEEQESAYLFEFFSLKNNKQINQQIKQHNLGQLAQLTSAKEQTNTIKQTIELIAKTFDNKFDNMVSLYMKLRAMQINQLTKDKLNIEEKAKLFELVNLEKLLMIVNSVYIKQRLFHKQLADAKLGVDGVVGASCSQALTATVTLCESSFVSELTIDKLSKKWQLNELTGQSYVRLLTELITFLHTLPLALFNHNPANIQKIVSGIRSLIVDKSQNIATTKSSGTGLNILKPKSKLIKYV